MRKIIIVLFILCLLTGCGNKSEQNKHQTFEKEKTQITENKSEQDNFEPLFIEATYVTYLNNETLNDDFYAFHNDGKFYRQFNECECYTIEKGTYEIIEKNGEKIINLHPNDGIERHMKYEDDKITFIEEADDERDFLYKQGCGFFMNEFIKTDDSNVNYNEHGTCDIYDR